MKLFDSGDTKVFALGGLGEVGKNMYCVMTDNEIIITFPSKKIDELASILTYGTGKIQGCSILREAFGRY